MDDSEGSPPALSADIETEVKEMMGLFDLPAFARRGQDLEITRRRLHERCCKARLQLLDMVQLRLRQWSRAVTGPDAWPAVFTGSARLAARHFQPVPLFTAAILLDDHPMLPVPELRVGDGSHAVQTFPSPKIT